MPEPFVLKQPALGAEPHAAVSLQWRRRGDPVALWHKLQALHAPGAVIGIGAPLARAVGADVPGLRDFEPLRRGRYTMPATQFDLWALVPVHDAGQAFDQADALATLLAPQAELVESTPMFSYRRGRDLTSYRDGTENPTGERAWAAALVAGGAWAGSSHVLVQRWRHFRERFLELPEAERDRVIGRRLVDDTELAEAPESAHVKRTAQEDFDPPAFMLRRSMPWGDARRHGLQFIAFVADPSAARRQLERMMGLEDGLQDALLAHSQAETGAMYWCPPWDGQRLVLPAVSAALAPPAPLPAPAPARVRVLADGPLEAEGALSVDGVPVAQARLCRCGHSGTKPWCDGAHAAAGFRAAGELPPLDEPQAEVGAAVLRIRSQADGPLVVAGAVELCSQGGRTITRCVGPTLCRCGHSANKPFCDGSHAGAGFTAPG